MTSFALMMFLVALLVALCAGKSIDTIRVFENPLRQNPADQLFYPVDACVSLGVDCGFLAAQRFCIQNGYTNATGFDGHDPVKQPLPHCATTLTAMNEVCTPETAGACGCFRYIVCSKPVQ